MQRADFLMIFGPFGPSWTIIVKHSASHSAWMTREAIVSFVPLSYKRPFIRSSRRGFLWDKTADGGARFEIDDAHAYLPIPFLDALLHDIRHPKRLKALGLEDHLARAIGTLNRVNRPLFRARMTFPTIDKQTTTAAITYFYEPLLEAADPKPREDRGDWDTHPDIARY